MTARLRAASVYVYRADDPARKDRTNEEDNYGGSVMVHFDANDCAHPFDDQNVEFLTSVENFGAVRDALEKKLGEADDVLDPHREAVDGRPDRRL